MTRSQLIQIRYRRRNRQRIREHARLRRKFGSQYWLRAAFIKAGGRAEDWPIMRRAA